MSVNSATSAEDHSVILVTAGYDNTIRSWDALRGIVKRSVPFTESHVNRLCISFDKRWLAASGSPHLRLWDVRNLSSPPMLFEGHSSNVTAIAFMGDGRTLVSTGEDGTIRIWSIQDGRLVQVFDVGHPITDAVLHPNEEEIVLTDQNGHVQVWDLRRGQCMAKWVPEEDVPASAVSVSYDGMMLAVANYKGRCYIYRFGDEPQPVHVKTFAAHDRYVTRCVISPNGLLLATCSADGTVKVWQTEDWKVVKVLRHQSQRWVWDCAFSADSAYLVSASTDHTALLWDLGTGESVRQYTSHTKGLTCVAMNDIQVMPSS